MKRACLCFLLLWTAFAWAGDWAMMYHDPAHTSSTPDSGPSTRQFAWSYQIGPALPNWDYIHISSPAVVNGKVYVGSINGRVYCFDHSGGPPLWVKQLRDTVFSSPAVVDGKVYAGTWNGYLYCLNANTGDSLWRYYSGGKIETGPTVADGRVFFGAWYQNYIWCLDANTGARLWRATPDPGYMYGHGGLPAVSDSLAIVGASNLDVSTKFYAYREFSTAPDVRWAYTVASGENHQAPTISGGRVFGSVDDGWLYALNEFPPSQNGELLWSQRSAPGYSGDPSCVSVEGNRIYYGHEVGYAYCRDAVSGGLIWRSPHLGGHCGVGSASLSGNGKIYVGTGYAGGGSSTQALFCLDKATGDSLWSYRTGGWVTSSPAISNGMVFVTSQDGYLYAFGTWTTGTEEATSSLNTKQYEITFKATPNPFTSFATLPGHESERFALYDMSGREVGIFRGDRIGAGLRAGVYFLRRTGGNDRPVRIVKVR